ncbi:MAG: hypothetical protein ACK58L_01085 [Planctomycetota bacterium]
MDSSRNGLLSTILMTLPLIAVPAMALLRPPGQAGVSSRPLEAREESSKDFLLDTEEDTQSSEDDELLFEQEDEQKDSKRTADSKRGKKRDTPGFDEIFDDVPARKPKSKTADSDDGRMSTETTDEFDDLLEEVDSDSGSAGLKDPFIEESGDDDPKAPETNAGRGSPGKEKSSGSRDKAPAEREDQLPQAEEIVEQLTARGAVRTKWFEAGERYPVGFAVYFRGRSEDERIRFEAVGQTRDDCARDVLQQIDAWQQRREKSQPAE